MGRPKQAARDTERDGCPRAFNDKKKKNKQLPYRISKEKQKRTNPRWQCWRSPAEGAGKGAGCAGVRGVQLGETRCGQMNEGGELRRESRAGSWELENRGVSGTRDLRSWEGTGNRGRKRETRRGERKMIRKTNKL